MIIIDGEKGFVIVNPTQELLLLYKKEQEVIKKAERSLKDISNLPNETKDGHKVLLYVNYDPRRDSKEWNSFHSEGLGLLRTEFIFLNRFQPPTEEEQIAIYKKSALRFGTRPFTVRLADLGGDKISTLGLYYMQLPGGIIYRTNMTGSSNPEQITTSGPAEMSDTSYQIIVYDKDRITYLNRSGDFYVYNKGELDTYFRKMPGKIRGAQFSNDGKKILFWSDNEILAYFSRKWEVQPTRMENELATVTRFSEPVVDVQWTKDYEHIIFATGKKIKVIELDPRDHRTMEDVLDISADSTHLVSNHSDGNLYFTDKNSAGIVTIQSIAFPEKTGILGF
jgi:hypothetical protein